MFRTRMEAVSAAVMLRRIAVLGERGMTTYLLPSPCISTRKIPEPYLVVYPVRLQHIG